MKQNLRRIQLKVMIVFMTLSFTIANLTFAQTVSASGAAGWEEKHEKELVAFS